MVLHSDGLPPGPRGGALPLLGPRPVLDAALLAVELGRPGRDGAMLDALRQLAGGGAALTMRLAMLLAWLRQRDLIALGYSSFSAFVRSEVGLGASWVRGLAALVRSDLDDVKRAASRGEIPLRLAVLAPGAVAANAQAVWLEEQRGSSEPEVDTLPIRVDADHAAPLHEARALARVLIGRRVSNAEVDRFLVDVHRRRVPAKMLLRQARVRPERPRPSPVSFAWCAGDAPAEDLLGPLVEPSSTLDGVEQVRVIVALRGARDAVMCRAWAVLDHLGLADAHGYSDRWALARDVFGWPKRTAQRRARVGWALEWYPALDEAVRGGLPLSAASLLARVVTGDRGCERWLRIASRVGQVELMQALRDADASVRPGDLARRYEEAIEAADLWAARAENGTAPLAGAPIRVALTHPLREPVAPPGHAVVEGAVDEVLAASAWLLAHVRLPDRSGFDRVKDRDRHQCQNPECGRITLRVEAHHVVHRQHGGGDALSNGVAVCRPCHLRGLHRGSGDEAPPISARSVVVGERPALLWSFAGAHRHVLQFRHCDGGPRS